MARKGARKLFLFGRYSLALLLPKKWLTELGSKRGDLVALEYDRARKRIVIRFSSASNLTPTKPEKPKPIEPDPELEPIPEL